MATRPDFLAGNTRLRAWLPALEALPAEPDPARRAAAGADLLRRVGTAYGEPAGQVVGVLVARHDLADTLALLRGALRGRPAGERLAGVSGLGRVTAEAAADVAAAPDPAAVVGRLRSRALPDPAVAARMEAIWSAYELHDDADELEVDLATTAHHGWRDRLRPFGRAAAPVAELLAEERDLANLRTVVRVRGTDPPRLLPVGRIGAGELAAATRGDWRPAARARPGWQLPLDAEGHGPAPRDLEERVRELRLARAVPALRRGDVFTVEPAVAFVVCAEAWSRPDRPSTSGAAPDPARAAA